MAIAAMVVLGSAARHLSIPVTLKEGLVCFGLVCLIMLTPVLTRRVKSSAIQAVPIGISLMLLILGAGWRYGGLLAPVTAMLPILPILGFCFGGRPLAMFMLAGSILCVTFLYFSGTMAWGFPAYGPEVQARNDFIVLSFLTATGYLIGAIYERSRRSAEQHLVEVSRLASLGVMAGGVAHEINNPLMIAIGFGNQLVELARTGELESQEVERLAQHVVTSTERVAAIVQGLRTYSRDSAHEDMAPVALAQVVEDTLVLCKERFRGAGIDLRVAPVPSGFEVLGRRTQISQVLHNVLNNAFDAVQGVEERWVSLEFLASQDVHVIRVVDSGPGIKPEYRDQIFVPFYTTKDIGKGIGLGLSVSASIMAEHGGEIGFDARAARTTFFMRFPALNAGQRMVA